VLWCWVRGKWAESSGEPLPVGEGKEVKRGVVVAKVDSGRGTGGRGGEEDAKSRRATPSHSRQTSSIHSRQGSIAGISAIHAGVIVSTSRVSPSTVASPSQTSRAVTPALSRQIPAKESKQSKTAAKDAAYVSSSFAVGKKRKSSASSCGLGSLEHKTLHLVFSFLSFHDVFHPRSNLATVSRRCLHSALHLLLSLNLSTLSTLSNRNSALKSSLSSSLSAAALRTHLTALSSTRSHLTAALSSLSPSTLKAIRALVKPPSSIVPVFEGVLLTMELRDGVKERRRREKDQRDMTLTAHKSVVAHPHLLSFLSSLTPRFLLQFLDTSFLSRLHQLTSGLDAGAIEKSSPLAGPLARWLVAVWEWTEWCKGVGGGWAAGGVVAGLVELEDGEWRLRCAAVMGMTDGEEGGEVKEEKIKEYAAAMGVARVLRGR
jgi:hypothetical protein